MQILVAFKNIESSDDAKEYLKLRFKRFEKMIHSSEVVHAVFRLEKSRYVIDINLASKNIDIHASDEGSTFNEAIDLVVEKVRKQLIKIKEKLENHR